MPSKLTFQCKKPTPKPKLKPKHEAGQDVLCVSLLPFPPARYQDLIPHEDEVRRKTGVNSLGVLQDKAAKKN